MFKINNNFLKSSHHLLDLKLCTVRLHEMHIKWRFMSLTGLEKTIT